MGNIVESVDDDGSIGHTKRSGLFEVGVRTATCRS